MAARYACERLNSAGKKAGDCGIDTIAPSHSGLPGQVPNMTEPGRPVWMYPLGHGREFRGTGSRVVISRIV